jgi:hypothetical protein
VRAERYGREVLLRSLVAKSCCEVSVFVEFKAEFCCFEQHLNGISLNNANVAVQRGSAVCLVWKRTSSSVYFTNAIFFSLRRGVV